MYLVSMDPLGYDRATLIPLLFRETDRSQRMRAPLCLMAICPFELSLITGLNRTAVCEDAMRQIRAAGLCLDDLTREHFPLPSLKPEAPVKVDNSAPKKPEDEQS